MKAFKIKTSDRKTEKIIEIDYISDVDNEVKCIEPVVFYTRQS